MDGRGSAARFSESYPLLITDSCRHVFKLFRPRVNASSNFATVTFFTVFKMCRHRVNAVLDWFLVDSC